MTELGTGAPPLPSISVPPWITKACGCCASTGPKTPDASTAKHETNEPPKSNFLMITLPGQNWFCDGTLRQAQERFQTSGALIRTTRR